jgi:hypothetical protein
VYRFCEELAFYDEDGGQSEVLWCVDRATVLFSICTVVLILLALLTFFILPKVGSDLGPTLEAEPVSEEESAEVPLY